MSESNHEQTLLERIRGHYDQGRFAEAIAAGGPLGPLEAWSSTPARLLAGRLAARVGRPRLSQAQFFRAARNAPADPEACEFFANVVARRRGPDRALAYVRSFPERERHPRLRAFEGVVLSELRDFERAHRLLDSAIADVPDDPYLHVQRAIVAEREDAIDDALASLDHALAIRDGFPPALHQKSRLLAHRDRRREALATLDRPRVEHSFELLVDRAELRLGARDLAGADADLTRAREVLIAAESSVLDVLAARASEVAYLRRDHRRAARLAREVTRKPFVRFAESLDALDDGAPPPRVELEVPIVRQRHMTCAPASLASIARFHGDPVDHNAIAGSICYAGTPSHHSRAWTEEQGYVAREFDVTLDAARRLLDAGFPFVLSTVATHSAHAQVAVGYDLARGSILVRDPSLPELVEYGFELLEAQSFHGPRGLVFAPSSRGDAIEALDLPNTDAWELRYRLAKAIDRHDLAEAKEALATLESSHPDSTHALTARLSVVSYEADRDATLATLDALLERHVDALSWVSMRASSMAGRHSRDEIIAYLERFRHRDDPVLLSMLADYLRLSRGRRTEAARLLRRLLRIAPWDGVHHHVLADLTCLEADERSETLERYRFASLLAEHDGHFARAYWDEACRRGDPDEALRWLERRAERAEHRATEPATTLFDVHLASGNPERGIDALEQLVARRQDDGNLLLELVSVHLANGSPDRAREAFARIGDKPVRRADYQLTASRLAREAGRLDECRRALEEALALDPERMAVVDEYARVLDELEGNEAVVAFLEGVYRERPHLEGVLPALAFHLRRTDRERAMALLRERLERHADDLWARRELALLLASAGRNDEAVGTAEEALRREPDDPACHSVLASCLRAAGRFDEARAALRTAIAIEPEGTWAIDVLRSLPGTAAIAREDARFVLATLTESPGTGNAFAAAIDLAAVLDEDERAPSLAAIFERVSRWPVPTIAWIDRAIAAGDLDEAERLSRAALERFPRWFAMHERRAEVQRLTDDRAGREATLRGLLALSPGHVVARSSLALSLFERGEFEEGLALVDEGLRIAPFAGSLLDARARLLDAAGRPEEAFETRLRAIREAIARDEDVESAIRLGRRLDRLGEVEAALRARAEADSSSAVPIRRLAMLKRAPEEAEARIALLREAVRRAPFDPFVIDELVAALVDAGRYEEALREVDASAFGANVPLALRGRRAWVLRCTGRVNEAIEAARTILAESPGYVWLRMQLCDWLESLHRGDEFLAHANELVRHAPVDARSHCYLGDALLATHAKRDDVIAAFQRAVELDPYHAYAAQKLVGFELEARRWEDADATLARTRHCLPAGFAHAIASRIAANRFEWDVAHDELAAAIRAGCDEVALGAACEAIALGPRFDDALALFEERFLEVDERTPAFSVANVYAKLRDTRARSGRIGFVGRVGNFGPTGVHAVSVMLEDLAVAKSWFVFFLAWIRHRRAFASAGPVWGSVGFALTTFGLPRLVLRWLADFERQDAKPWMLYNFVEAAWSLGRRDDAVRAGRRALAMPRDNTTDRHRLWLALDARIEGEQSADADAIDDIPCRIEDHEAVVFDLVHAIDEARSLGPGASVDELLRAVVPRLAGPARRAGKSPMLRPIVRRVVATIARDRGLVAYLRLRLRVFVDGGWR